LLSRLDLVELESFECRRRQTAGTPRSAELAMPALPLHLNVSQPDELRSIAWLGFPAAPAKPSVCAHTSIDNGKPLAFTVVDPPSDLGSKEEGVVLLESAARFVQAIEAIEQFNVSEIEGNV
jgi:hypothetical protein